MRCPSCDGCAGECTCESGADAEREAIIAFLRRDAFRLNSAEDAAAAVERGEHHRFKKKP